MTQNIINHPHSRVRLFLSIVSMLTGGPCFAASLPDLIPTSISYNSTSGLFTSVVRNQGNAATPTGVTVGVAYLVDGTKCTWGFTNTPLAPGASATIGTQGGACVIPVGTHTITVFADDVNRMQESNKNNNTLSKTITVGSLPDLIPTSISYDKTSGLFTSVVRNQGNAATPTGVVIGVAYLVDGAKQTWGVVNGPLAAGASVTISTQGGAYNIITGTHTITVVADDVNRIVESNKNNNTLSKTITVGPPATGQLVTIASLTANNTSAYASYNQTNFPANFGARSYVSDTQTVTIDPTKMDVSMNPVSPGNVSGMDVHRLVPSRPDLRWFVHLMAGWWGNGQPTNAANGQAVNIGYTENTDAYVAALIQDLVRRGFNGVFIIWNGIGSPSDQVAGRIKTYIAANLAGKFTYAIMIDEGLVIGSGNKVGTLETAVNYLNTTYFGDPNYEKEGTKAFLPMYGVGFVVGDTGMNTAKAAVGATSVWGQNSTASINSTWSDFTLDWTNNFVNFPSPGYNVADPYNLAALGNYYTTVASVPAKKAMGAMTAGFNGTLTGSTTWSLGKYLPQNSGAAMVQRAGFINTNIPRNVTRMQWATWNDYTEGSSVEPGIENNFAVNASIAGLAVNWTYTSGTGDESTIDHYEVYASADDVNAADLGSMSAGLHAFSLGSMGLTSGTVYTIMVVAVGKPCIRNHVSNSVSFTAP